MEAAVGALAGKKNGHIVHKDGSRIATGDQPRTCALKGRLDTCELHLVFAQHAFDAPVLARARKLVLLVLVRVRDHIARDLSPQEYETMVLFYVTSKKKKRKEKNRKENRT